MREVLGAARGRRARIAGAGGPLALGASLLVAACAAPGPANDRLLGAWVGQPGEVLIDVWGPPQEAHPSHPWTIAVYRWELAEGWRWLDAGTAFCDVTFLVVGSEISFAEWHGDPSICHRWLFDRPVPGPAGARGRHPDDDRHEAHP